MKNLRHDVQHSLLKHIIRHDVDDIYIDVRIYVERNIALNLMGRLNLDQMILWGPRGNDGSWIGSVL